MQTIPSIDAMEIATVFEAIKRETSGEYAEVGLVRLYKDEMTFIVRDERRVGFGHSPKAALEDWRSKK